MTGKSCGFLPDRMIANLLDEGQIRTDSICNNISVQPSGIELTADADVVEIPPGDVGTVKTSEILDLHKKYTPLADARSSVAKTDTELEITGEGGYPLEAGYSGRLEIKVKPYSFPIRIEGGTPLANMRFFMGDINDVLINREELIGILKKSQVFFDGHNNKPGTRYGYKLKMHLGLMNGSDVVGLRAKKTDKVLVFKPGENLERDFFEYIMRCYAYDAEPDGFILLQTREQIYTDPLSEIPFIAKMPRVNFKGRRVNRAEWVEYGSGPHNTIMEIPVDGGGLLQDGQNFSEMELYRLLGRPKTQYNCRGNRNNASIAGTFFYR